MNIPVPPLTNHDDVHAELARGAVKHAVDHLEAHATGQAAWDTPTADIVQEVISAWMATGLVHESYSQRDLEEIARAMIGQVATVLVMVGWNPAIRLLTAAPDQNPAPS